MKIVSPSPTTTLPTIMGLRWDVAAALLVIWVVWGTTYLAIKLALASFAPHFMIGIRFLVAGAIMFVFLKMREAQTPTRAEWRNATIVGSLLLAGGVGITAIAEQYVSSAMTVTLIASAPIWNVLWAAPVAGLPKRVEWLGIGVGFVGVAMLMFDKTFQAQPQGLLLQFSAMTCWAIGSALGRKLILPAGAMANAIEMLMGGAVCMLISFARSEPLPTSFEPVAVWSLIYLITFGSILSYTAYMHVLRNVRPALASSYAFINPIVGITAGYLIAGETVAPIALVSVGIIITGVVLMTLVRRDDRRTTRDE